MVETLVGEAAGVLDAERLGISSWGGIGMSLGKNREQKYYMGEMIRKRGRINEHSLAHPVLLVEEDEHDQ